MEPKPVPDLSDPVQRAAYRRELRQVAVWPRRGGVALATLGGLLTLSGPAVGLHLPDGVLLVILGAGVVGMGVGIAQRTAWHRRRMAGGGPSS